MLVRTHPGTSCFLENSPDEHVVIYLKCPNLSGASLVTGLLQYVTAQEKPCVTGWSQALRSTDRHNRFSSIYEHNLFPSAAGKLDPTPRS